MQVLLPSIYVVYNDDIIMIATFNFFDKWRYLWYSNIYPVKIYTYIKAHPDKINSFTETK